MNQSRIIMSAADYALIIGLFIVMLGVGWYFAGRARNARDFFAGGQAVPWWLASISYWMTSFSAFAFVAHSSLAYRFGFLPITVWWIGSLAAIGAAHLVAARWRRVATTSPLEFVEERYGRAMRQGLAWIGTILVLLDDATKILAVSYMISTSLGIPLKLAIVSCGSIVLCYTFAGGLWAVLVNDCVQFVVMLTAVIILVPLTLGRVGGWEQFLHDLPSGSLSPVGGKYTWLYLGLLGVLQFLAYCTRWSLVQRFYAVPTDRDARRVCYLVAGLNVAFAPMLVFPAMAARIFLPGVENPDQIYGLICGQLLPTGMLGMLVAAILSSSMSALSGDYNATAAVLMTDVYRRLFARDSTERRCLLAGRMFTMAVGLATMGVALGLAALGGRFTLFDLMVLIFSVFLPAMAIPVIAGLTSRRVSNVGAIAGVLTGIAVSGLAAFWDPYLLARPFDCVLRQWGTPPVSALVSEENMLMITSLVSVLLGMTAGTIVRPGTARCQLEIGRFLDGLSAEEQVEGSETAPEHGFSPAPIVGAAIMAIGSILVLAVSLTDSPPSGIWSIGAGATMFILGGALMLFPALRERAPAETAAGGGRGEDLLA